VPPNVQTLVEASTGRKSGEGLARTSAHMNQGWKGTRSFIDVYEWYDPVQMTTRHHAWHALRPATLQLDSRTSTCLDVFKQTNAASQRQRAGPTGRWKRQLGHLQRREQSRPVQNQQARRERQKSWSWKARRRPGFRAM